MNPSDMQDKGVLLAGAVYLPTYLMVQELMICHLLPVISPKVFCELSGGYNTFILKVSLNIVHGEIFKNCNDAVTKQIKSNWVLT